MLREDLYAKVIDVIADSLDMDAEELGEEAAFDELGADSFDLLEMVTALEEEFDVRCDDSVLTEVRTVGDAVDAIAEALGAE